MAVWSVFNGFASKVYADSDITTGYTHAMMDIVSVEASKKGYEPDALVTPEDVGDKGRPAPDMIFPNMQLLGIEGCQTGDQGR